MVATRRSARLAPTLAMLAALALTAAPLLAQTPARKGGSSTPARPTTRPAPAKAAPAARPAGEQLDAIAAMVNDEPVLASDVEEQLFLFVQRTGAHPDSAQTDSLRHQVLDQLIDEKLVLAEAKRQNVTVSDAEVAKQVDAAIADAKQRLGGEDEFQAQLQRENTTEARLRDRYKQDVTHQLMGQRLVQKLFPKKSVTQSEAEAYFLAHKDKFPKVPGEVRVSVIQISPSPDSAALAAGLAKAQALRKRIAGGEKFAKVAQEASDDPGSAKSGGDLGFFARGAMDKSLEQAAFSLRIGELSQPIRSAFGWHLLEVLDRDTLRTAAGKDSLDEDGHAIPEAHARHILVAVSPTQDDAGKALTLANDVHAQAAKGVNFASLVHRYSNYQGPASPDGDVGFLSLGQLQPQIRAALDSLEIGQISEVLPNQAGYNIFKVTDRHPERDYELAEIKNELPDAVSQVQFRERYDAWIQQLRAKAQIEYRTL